jgi:hypothetical protein
MSDFPRIFTVELAAVARSPGRSLAVARRVLPLESLTHAILLCALARRASSASRPTDRLAQEQNHRTKFAILKSMSAPRCYYWGAICLFFVSSADSHVRLFGNKKRNRLTLAGRR